MTTTRTTITTSITMSKKKYNWDNFLDQGLETSKERMQRAKDEFDRRGYTPKMVYFPTQGHFDRFMEEVDKQDKQRLQIDLDNEDNK
jgi:hypothetical protein